MGLRTRKIIALFLLIFVTFLVASCGTAKQELNPEKQQGVTDKQEVKPGEDNSATSDSQETSETENPIAVKYRDLLEKSKSIDSYYCEVIMKAKIGNNVEIPSKMWIKGNKMKVEQKMGPALITINYWDLEEKVMYTYTKESNTATKMEVPATNGLNQKLDSLDFDDNIIDKGKTTVDGTTCLVLEYKSGNTSGILYVSEDNALPVKSEVFQNNELKMEMIYKNYEIGKVTEEMVTLPAGTKITSD